MANLVAPINPMRSLYTREKYVQEEQTIEFKGLNRKAYIEDGEMSAMKNMSSDNYPTLTPRKNRSIQAMPSGVTPLSISSRYGRLCIIGKKANNDIAFYYGGGKSQAAISEVASVTGLTANSKMVAINSRLCFFPQKKYLELMPNGDLVTIGNYKDIEASIPDIAVGTTISVNVATTSSAQTLTFPAGTSLSMFASDDAINITGVLTPTSGTAKNVTISCLVKGISNNVMTIPSESFIELTVAGTSTGTLTLGPDSVTRKCPGCGDNDFVCEWNNRLWMAVSDTNTIYCSKLGDPTNWQYYQGTSIDSYYAEQGTDGKFTGYATYSQHLIFFKESYMTKIYGTAPSSFQVTNTRCYGVEEGSSKSVAIVNDSVFYKSTVGMMCYDGSTPYEISQKFGDTKFRSVVGGTDGTKYYLSLDSKFGDEHEYHMLALDIDQAVWHEEDSTRMVDCLSHNGHMYFIASDGVIYITNRYKARDEDSTTLMPSNELKPTNTLKPTGSGESGFDWMATFGPFTEYAENKKIFSKLSLRIDSYEDSNINVSISMDEGEWENIYSKRLESKGSVVIPIIPRRCDRFSIKISGTGNAAVRSLTRRYRVGSYV